MVTKYCKINNTKIQSSCHAQYIILMKSILLTIYTVSKILFLTLKTDKAPKNIAFFVNDKIVAKYPTILHTIHSIHSLTIYTRFKNIVVFYLFESKHTNFPYITNLHILSLSHEWMPACNDGIVSKLEFIHSFIHSWPCLRKWNASNFGLNP